MDVDVLIIGSGVVGSAIAYYLAKTDLKIAVIEKEEDVCTGTSKANSGIVHAGFDAMPNTLKAKFNVEGSHLIPELAKLLDFEYKQNGALVLCFDKKLRDRVEALYQRGLANGVTDLKIIEKDEILKLEPNVNEDVVCALYAPTSGIVCPFGMTIALAENAADNGVQFIFNEAVETIERVGDGWLVNDHYHAKVLVNAAGLYADEIHNQFVDQKIEITPRRGEYLLFDRTAGDLCAHTLFQLPTEKGKGVLITPTVHGNILVGPNAQAVPTKENVNTTAIGQDEIKTKARITIKDLPFNQVIRTFSGLRATPNGPDFIIGQTADHFYDAAGIESPGLSSAPAIGKWIAEQIREQLNANDHPHYIAKRKGFIDVKKLSNEQWNELIQKDPAYGIIVCRCETITAGSIQDALSRSLPARSLDGIKRRVRAGMGRCQAGFCLPRSMEIMQEKLGLSFEEIQLTNSHSKLITSKVKEGIHDGKQ
ncbi:MAG: NAD(P)/FAD-dependent oxidoreductase [Erysipelotrichaceae bacterium]|nr:NAD(P)/FAD-dependent oxidoreductase [Erysipelotrichaceae bacterium]